MISERALKTYEALQKRKKERERQKRDDIEGLRANSYWRVFRNQNSTFYSLGHKK
jgi:hypothetical protein